jgi:Rod binding domain-containing protein
MQTSYQPASAVSLSQSSAMPAALTATHAAAQKSAEEFEAVLLNTLLAPMFEGLGTDDPLTGGSAEQTWRGLLVEEYANSMAAQGGIGVAESVYRELIAMQEQAT